MPEILNILNANPSRYQADGDWLLSKGLAELHRRTEE